jgi:hypothetical protein
LGRTNRPQAISVLADPPPAEWMLETSQHQWSFWTPDYKDPGPGGTPEFPYTSPPLDDNHQLRNPRVTFENPNGYATFSNLVDHRGNLGNPTPYITPDGRSVGIKVKSWGHTFPIYLWADVYRRGAYDKHDNQI